MDSWTYNKFHKKENFSEDAFLDFWKPKKWGGQHDYKNMNPPSSEIYDAFGNFGFGSTGCGAGFDLDWLLWAGDKGQGIWSGINKEINSEDIISGFNAIKAGGKLSVEQRSLLP